MLSRRHEDWPNLMKLFLEGAQDRAFAWGTWDCCLMALAHADALTGSGLYDAYKGQYHDAATGQAVIDGLGGMRAAAADIFGGEIDNVKFLQRGDVCLFDSGQGPAMGFIGLDATKIMALVQDRTGLVRLPRSRLIAGWRI